MDNQPRSQRRGDPELGLRLQTARRAAGYRSAREACVIHGWSEPQYRSHEAGTRLPSPASLATYAAAFKVDQDWLTSHTGKGPQIDPMRIAQLEIRMQMGPQASGSPESARRLRLARRLASYRSASAAATAHGWNRASYHAHETGKIGLSRAACQTYAEAFGIRAEWLLNGELPTGWTSAVEAQLSDLLALYEAPETSALEQLPQEPDLPRIPKPPRVPRVPVKLRRKFDLLDNTASHGLADPQESENSASIGEYGLDALRAMEAKKSDLRRWLPSHRFIFPRSYIKDVLGADPDHTIIAVATHDEPRLALRSGDRLIIDTASRLVTTGDLFVAMIYSESRLVVIDHADLNRLGEHLLNLDYAAAVHIGHLIGRYCGRLQAT